MSNASMTAASREVAVLETLFAAVEERDGAPMGRLYAPDVVIHEAPCLPYGGEYRGLAGVMEHAVAYTLAWDRLQTVADRRMDPRFFAADEWVLVAWRQRAHGAGGALDMPMVSQYRLADLRIVESRMLAFDTVALVAFLRAQPPATHVG